MTATPEDRALQDLAALRQNIDRIDENVHRLLIERGEMGSTKRWKPKKA